MTINSNAFRSALVDRRREAAIRHSRFDKSDPFVFNRAMSHIYNGIVDFRTVKEGGKDRTVHCLYDADTYPARVAVDERWASIAHLGTIKEVNSTSYRNVCRP